MYITSYKYTGMAEYNITGSNVVQKKSEFARTL